MSLQNRYTDAYLVARTADGTGQTIKLVCYLIAGLMTVSGIVSSSKFGIIGVFGGLLLGVLSALPLYALGVLVSAQGQILKATLDTAVNSSPLLSPDEIRSILTGLPSPVRSEQPPAEQAPPRMGVSPSEEAMAEKNCPHCGGTLKADVSLCRWCMKKV